MSACTTFFGACVIVGMFDLKWFASMTGPRQLQEGPYGLEVSVGERTARLDFDNDRDFDLVDVAELQRRFAE